MKPPINLTEPLDDLTPFLLEDLPFDPTIQFTSMGFQRKKSYPRHQPKLRDGRNNIKRNINREDCDD